LGYAVPPTMALLFILDDEVVKLSPHARAIRDVEDEEIWSFSMFILMVAASLVGEELFYRAPVQRALEDIFLRGNNLIQDVQGMASLKFASRNFKIRDVSSTEHQASRYIPATLSFLPEGPWKQAELLLWRCSKLREYMEDCVLEEKTRISHLSRVMLIPYLSLGRTQMNEQSSRSHFVFTLCISGINENTEQQVQAPDLLANTFKSNAVVVVVCLIIACYLLQEYIRVSGGFRNL
ncbi:hypothetical protein RYX36_009219, partial [Vicia faba]